MKIKLLLVCTAGLLMMGSANYTQAQTTAPKKSKIPASLKAQAKISLADARATAVGKVSGEIKEEELEKEHGKLVYSFDIQAKGEKDITEVQVSAIDGSIVSVEKEDAASEAKEKQEEQAKKNKSAVKP